MKSAPIPANETKRLESLYRLQVLDTLPEREYEDIVTIASAVCDTPVALLSLVDRDRQWFKARLGFAPSETSRDISFCAYAILGEQVFVVPDADADERFQGNPLVDESGVRFYAGAPLVGEDGLALGTICVIDTEARTITQQQLSALQALSRLTMQLLLNRAALDRSNGVVSA